jgi:hypothetical protein
MMFKSENPKARNSGLVIQEMPGEVLVFDTASNKAHCLNESAALVWKSCDGTKSAAEIAKEFEKNNLGTVSEDFVWLALDQLSGKGLLENKVKPRFTGRSRREALKAIGLASVVALPVIASLVAPPNALAATSCNCSANSDCTTQMCATTFCDNMMGSSSTFTCTATA